MNKAELIARIRTERDALEAVLAPLSSEQWVQPATLGAWSAKDALAHLAVWTSRVITLLYEVEHDLAPSYPTETQDPDWAKTNARDYESQKDRPLDRVLADFRGTHRQLLRRLDALRDDVLLAGGARYSFHGQPLVDVVWSGSAAHDAEHRIQIEAWQRGQKG